MKDFAYSLLQPWTYGSVSGATGQTPKVVSVISMILQRLVSRNDEKSMLFYGKLTTMTVFHGLRAPSITVDKYLDRIFKFANCSPSCFVVAYIYIDRLLGNHPPSSSDGACITSLNIHRLLITSIMLAAKFMDDAYYNNAYYAKVGGISTLEMNKLELEFLFRVGFRLHVTVSAFENYCLHLQREAMVLQVERPLMPCCYFAEQEAVPQIQKHHQLNFLMCQQQQQQQLQRMLVWRSYAGV